MRRHILRGLWSQDGVWHIVMEGKHFKSCCGRNFAPQGWTRKSFPRKDMCTKCWVAWEAVHLSDLSKDPGVMGLRTYWRCVRCGKRVESEKTVWHACRGYV
jgi:hypothetical protein